MKLYPIKFAPIFHERIWGGNNLKNILAKTISSDNIGESWELSGVENSVSIVSNGHLQGKNLIEILQEYKKELVGEKVYNVFENEFPLLFKYLDACDDLSIQVHPSDEIAQKKHHCNGKNEMWYVLESQDDARIIAGVKENCSIDIIKKNIELNTIENVLEKHPSEKGDVFHISDGIIHALGKGVLVAEIQQSSDITYRIFDYNRKDKNGQTRELHVEDALDCIKIESVAKKNVQYSDYITKQELVNCEYFITNLLSIHRKEGIDYSSVDSFVVYMCIDGKYTIKTEGNDNIEVTKGETILIPASIKNVEIFPANNSKVTILETYLP